MSRPLTAEERSRLAPVLSQTSIPVRVSATIELVEDVIERLAPHVTEQEPTEQAEL